MNFNLYIKGNSFLHRLSPFYKLIFLCFSNFFFFFKEIPYFNTFVVIFLIFIFRASKISFMKFIKFFKFIYLLLGIIFLVNYYYYGYLESFNKIIQLIFFVILGFLFTSTTKMSEMMFLFENILRKLKVKRKTRQKISLSFTLVIRFLPILFLEWKEFTNTYKLKGGKKRLSFQILPAFIIKILSQSQFYSDSIELRSKFN